MNADPSIVERGAEARPAAIPISPDAWATRAASIVALLREQQVDAADAGESLRELVLVDQTGAYWRYDGSRWERSNGSGWIVGTPSGSLWLQPFALDVPVPPAAEFPDDDPAALAARDSSPPIGRWQRMLTRARAAWYRLFRRRARA